MRPGAGQEPGRRPHVAPPGIWHAQNGAGRSLTRRPAMTAHLDAMQLDRAWDARILGLPLAGQIEDANDLQLLGLLSETPREKPPAAFVRSLERELGLV